MKWIDRLKLVMKSSITTLREKIEDPERMLHQLICDMEEELEAVRLPLPMRSSSVSRSNSPAPTLTNGTSGPRPH